MELFHRQELYPPLKSSPGGWTSGVETEKQEAAPPSEHTAAHVSFSLTLQPCPLPQQPPEPPLLTPQEVLP